jgi:hypothetical protein
MKKTILLFAGILLFSSGCGQQNVTVNSVSTTSNNKINSTISTETNKNKNDNFTFSAPNGWVEKKLVENDTVLYSLVNKQKPNIQINVYSPAPGLDFFGQNDVASSTHKTNDPKINLNYAVMRPCLSVDANNEDCKDGQVKDHDGGVFVSWDNAEGKNGMIIAYFRDSNNTLLTHDEEVVVTTAVQEIIKSFKFTNVK